MQNPLSNLVFCAKCEAVISTAFSNWPEYTTDGREIPKDDFGSFLGDHRCHRLDQLRVLSGPWSHKPFREPVKEEFFVVTDGKTRFVLKRWREKIDEPVVYELMRGGISQWIKEVRVDVTAIIKQMALEWPSYVSKSVLQKIRKFAWYVERTAATSPESFDLENAAVAMSPMTFRCVLRDLQLLFLRRNASVIFGQRQKPFVEDFITRHSVETDDILTVEVITDFKITKAA